VRLRLAEPLGAHPGMIDALVARTERCAWRRSCRFQLK
jgi:hypothetical protein